jgi:hypothetical protein
LPEAAEWARHFGQLEREMDELLAGFLGVPGDELAAWMRPGRYVSGREFAQAGLAELVDVIDLAKPQRAKGGQGMR